MIKITRRLALHSIERQRKTADFFVTLIDLAYAVHGKLERMARFYKDTAVNLHLRSAQQRITKLRVKQAEANTMYATFREWEVKEQARINAKRRELHNDALKAETQVREEAADLAAEAHKLGRHSIFDIK